MRNITEQQELAYRLVSGDFEGLTTEQAAERMGVTSRRVRQLLESVKAVAPQLFPLVTKVEANVLTLLKEGRSDPEICEALNLTVPSLKSHIQGLREKGRLERAGKVRVQRFEEHMADEVTRKF